VSTQALPDERGRYGEYGGRFVPETLVPALDELSAAFREAKADPSFQAELDELLLRYAGRETPVSEARRMSEDLGGCRVLLKREDLCHTGSHKLNNTLGQILLARRMGKKRIIAETGAGTRRPSSGSWRITINILPAGPPPCISPGGLRKKRAGPGFT
jgi:tryptophan synthase beta chain